MRTIYKKFFEHKFYAEILVASVLFITALILDMLMDFIIYMLYFIIFLEIVRAVINYIREQRVVLSLLVDAFIILALREFIVNVVKINEEELNTLDQIMNSDLNYNLFILAGTIIFLLFVRYLSVKTSQRYILKDPKKID